MKKTLLFFAPLAAIVLVALAGCRGGPCANCGSPYGYNYGTAPNAGYGTAQPGTYVQPGATVQPGTYSQPGVVVPQQNVPTPAQPGTSYQGSGSR